MEESSVGITLKNPLLSTSLLPVELLTPQNEGQFSLKLIAKGPFWPRQAAKVCSLIKNLKQLP
jgi:hypothetical protein